VQLKQENLLIAALSPTELQRWLPLLEPVEMPLGAVLYEPRVTLSHVYFPATAIVSLLYVVGFRLRAQAMKDEFNRAGAVMHLLLRYTQALITQMAQTAVCNRHHTLDQQLCRWLLLSLDRLQDNELVMTQELIANMLGVRREGVTESALKLQQSGLIKYARGHITILDRPSLEKRSCECYAVVKREYDRLSPALENRTH
jgi:hypothetical protein